MAILRLPMSKNEGDQVRGFEVWSFEQIKPLIIDNKTKKFLKYKNPNFNSRCQKQLSNNLLVINSFLLKISRVRKTPSQLPEGISIEDRRVRQATVGSSKLVECVQFFFSRYDYL